MISPRNLRLAFGLTCICSCLLQASEDPNLKPPILQFEESQVQLEAPGPVVAYAQAAGQKITYAVGLTPRPRATFLSYGVTGRPGFDKCVLTLDLSDGQKRYLAEWGRDQRRETTGTVGGVPLPFEEHSSGKQILLYAVSLEDAKKMAQGYIDCMTDVYIARRKLTQEYGIHTLWEAAAARKRLAEVEDALKTSPDDFEAFMKTSPYASEKEATDAIVELDNALNAIGVEISGIKARLEATQADLRGSGGSAGRRSALELMVVQESIALEGAEARRRTATDLRSQARRFVDLTKGPTERYNLLEKVAEYDRMLQRDKEELATRTSPQTVDNKAIIYPVRQSQ
jgi:hypothetical protein